jgi:HAMP domain-containing protein
MQHGGHYITEPIYGQFTGQPVVSMLEPMLDSHGKMVGMIMGVTNLAQPNFLDAISDATLRCHRQFLHYRTANRRYIMSSDKERLLKSGPPPGINPVYDRYINGYEGSGIAVSSRGVLELSSSVKIKSTGWLMQSVLPAAEAFAPIRTLQQQLFGMALCLTLLAGGISWWWLRRQLLPLTEATQLLNRMGDGELPKQALPVCHQDEVGLLATSFNSLLSGFSAKKNKRPSTRPTACCARSCRRFPAWCSSTGCLPMATVASLCQ